MYFSMCLKVIIGHIAKRKKCNSECVLGILLFLVQRTEFLNNCPISKVTPSAVLHMWSKDENGLLTSMIIQRKKSPQHSESSIFWQVIFPFSASLHLSCPPLGPPCWGECPRLCWGPGSPGPEQTPGHKQQAGASRQHPSASWLPK